jgi:hypothetical protein
MATAKKTENIVEIKPIVKKTVKVRIVGDSPLIMHAWDAKAKREILEKEIGAKKVKVREPKNPIADFVASMYWLTPCPEEMTAEAVGEDDDVLNLFQIAVIELAPDIMTGSVDFKILVHGIPP